MYKWEPEEAETVLYWIYPSMSNIKQLHVAVVSSKVETGLFWIKPLVQIQAACCSMIPKSTYSKLDVQVGRLPGLGLHKINYFLI